MEIADEGTSLRLLSLNSAGNSQELLDVSTPENTVLQEILDATPDGRFALVRAVEYADDEHQQGENKIMVIDCWGKAGEGEESKSAKFKDSNEDSEIKLLAGGNGIIAYDKKNHSLKIQMINTEDMESEMSPFLYDGRVEDVQLSQDGSVMLISGSEETFFVDLQQMILRGPNKSIRPTERLKGKNWHMIGNRILYNPDTNQTFYIATEQMAKTKEFIR